MAARSSIGCGSTRPIACATIGPRANWSRARVGCRLRNRHSVSRETDRVRLSELLAANQALLTVCLLKDDLKALWQYRHAGYAQRFWNGWYRRAMTSRIEPLKTFAKRLKPYLPGILAHCRWPLGYQPHRRHQAHGLRLPRRRLLLPQHQSCLPRQSVKNQKKEPAMTGSFPFVS